MQEKNWPNFSQNLIQKVVKVINSGNINYTYGTQGKKFENFFSKYIGNKYSIALCNGTAALEVALKSLELPKKSEIIVPARSFFSSAACIVNTGHIPIFADVDLITQNISLQDVKKKITKRTKAIICVHLGGMPCDMYNLKKIAKKNNLKIIEDCSQAHGASIENKKIIDFSDRESLRTEASGKLDGIKISMIVQTLKKNRCIYDFVLISPSAKIRTENKKYFEQFLKSSVIE